jgi:hypothetical protein
VGWWRGGEKEVRVITSKPVDVNSNSIETRQERREQRLKKKRERMPKHGKNLAKVYLDAVLKRLRKKE